MSKRLVICCDGTWNIPDQKDRGKVHPSNVVKMALALMPRDSHGVEQQLCYIKGVGTGAFERLRGGAFGWGLSQHIIQGYLFLMDQYEPDDEIFLFGFSRGAYTARSMVGLIRNAGILKQKHSGKLSEAYNLYRRRDDASNPKGVEAQLFRKMYAWDTRIKFIGVWDTVGSLGIPVGIPWLPMSWLQLLNRRWQFHDLTLSNYVDYAYAYQALAIDEKRPPFTPTLWEQPEPRPNMEQMWFAGVHTNVGGGYEDSGLSDIPFLWMTEKAAACGLALDPDVLQKSVTPNALGELRDSKTGLYKFLPDALRPIGQGKNANELVHTTAVERMERASDPPYHPENLRDYLEHGGMVTKSGFSQH